MGEKIKDQLDGQTPQSTPQQQQQPQRGVFISSTSESLQGLQLIGGTTKLEAYALVALVYERMRKDFGIE